MSKPDKSRRLTKEQRLDIFYGYQKGERREVIAARHGLPKNTISATKNKKWFKDLQVEYLKNGFIAPEIVPTKRVQHETIKLLKEITEQNNKIIQLLSEDKKTVRVPIQKKKKKPKPKPEPKPIKRKRNKHGKKVPEKHTNLAPGLVKMIPDIIDCEISDYNDTQILEEIKGLTLEMLWIIRESSNYAIAHNNYIRPGK